MKKELTYPKRYKTILIALICTLVGTTGCSKKTLNPKHDNSKHLYELRHDWKFKKGYRYYNGVEQYK